MARETKDEKDLAPDQAARAAAKDAGAETDEGAETYPHEWLIEASGVVGYRPHEIAGALSAISKKHLTIEEARAATKEWLVTPIQEA